MNKNHKLKTLDFALCHTSDLLTFLPDDSITAHFVCTAQGLGEDSRPVMECITGFPVSLPPDGRKLCF